MCDFFVSMTFIYIFVSGVGMLCFNRRFGCMDKTGIIDIKFIEDIFDAIDVDSKSLGFKPYLYVSTPMYRKFKRALDYVYRFDITGLIHCLKKNNIYLNILFIHVSSKTFSYSSF